MDGIFSVFDTRVLNALDFESDTDPVVLTPEGRKWNPYCTSYATNESAFTDDDGNLVPSEHIRQELIDDEDLNEETLDFSDVNAILAACE